MSQPISGDQWTKISGGVGTVVVAARQSVLKRVVIPGTYVGSVTLHDASAAAGTTSTSGFLTFGLPTTSIPQSIEVNANCKNGLVYEATGTPVMTLLWE